MRSFSLNMSLLQLLMIKKSSNANKTDRIFLNIITLSSNFTHVFWVQGLLLHHQLWCNEQQFQIFKNFSHRFIIIWFMLFENQRVDQNKYLVCFCHVNLWTPLDNVVPISNPRWEDEVLKVAFTWFVSIIIKSPMGKWICLPFSTQ